MMPNWHWLRAVVVSETPHQFESDSFVWRANPDNTFSICSISKFFKEHKYFSWPSNIINLLQVMWDLRIPPKLKVFVWRFFVERIPSKDLLMKKGVVTLDNMDCVICGR